MTRRKGQTSPQQMNLPQQVERPDAAQSARHGAHQQYPSQKLLRPLRHIWRRGSPGMPSEKQQPCASSEHTRERLHPPLTLFKKDGQQQQAKTHHEHSVEIQSSALHPSSATTASAKTGPRVTDQGRLHATCTGGITDLQAFEDAEQRALLAAVTLPYDPRTGQVLTGGHKGQPVWDAIHAEVLTLLRSFAHVTVTRATVRPWQRWWQPTSAYRLIPSLEVTPEPLR